MGFLEAKRAGNFLKTSVSMDVSPFTFHFYICPEGQRALAHFSGMFQRGAALHLRDEWTFIGHSPFTGLALFGAVGESGSGNRRQNPIE